MGLSLVFCVNDGTIFDQNRWQRRTKIKKFEDFFPLFTSAYAQKTIYNFVDFRIKNANPSNSKGGGSFLPTGKKLSKINVELRIQEPESCIDPISN